jgi:hypothetical protein
VRHRTDIPGVREWPGQQLEALEVLNRTFVSLRRLSSAERVKVSSPSRLGILLARIQSVLSGLQFLNQWEASTQVAVTTTPSQSSFPSARCTHGRVKLCTLIFMQRLGTIKFARFGAMHPVASVQTVRTNARLAFRKLAGFGRSGWLRSGTTHVFFTSGTSLAMIGCWHVKGATSYSKKWTALGPAQLLDTAGAKGQHRCAGSGNGFCSLVLLQHQSHGP